MSGCCARRGRLTMLTLAGSKNCGEVLAPADRVGITLRRSGIAGNEDGGQRRIQRCCGCVDDQAKAVQRRHTRTFARASTRCLIEFQAKIVVDHAGCHRTGGDDQLEDVGSLLQQPKHRTPRPVRARRPVMPFRAIAPSLIRRSTLAGGLAVDLDVDLLRARWTRAQVAGAPCRRAAPEAFEGNRPGSRPALPRCPCCSRPALASGSSLCGTCWKIPVLAEVALADHVVHVARERVWRTPGTCRRAHIHRP